MTPSVPTKQTPTVAINCKIHSLASAKLHIDRVHIVVGSAIEAANKAYAARCASEGQSLSSSQLAKLRACLKKHLANLATVVRFRETGFQNPIWRVLKSFGARVSALVRYAAKNDHFIPYNALMSLAKKLDFHDLDGEVVAVTWIVESEKPRPIVIFGRQRWAAAVMLRDVCIASGIGSSCDFAAKGKGGERGLIENVCKNYEEGYGWIASFDLKNYFLSLTREHMKELPISPGLIRSVAFLSEKTKIEVTVPKENLDLVWAKIGLSHSNVSTQHIEDITIQMLRQGLVLGSPLSPLLASWFLDKVQSEALAGKNVRYAAYADNVVICATSRKSAEAALTALDQKLTLHPAGSIELHQVEVERASLTNVIGYRLCPGKSHVGPGIHVKPGKPKTERFVRRLTIVLDKCIANGASGNELFEAAERYRKAWFGSLSAWTKVPVFSNEVSSSITATYVADYLSGIPMGTFYANSPPKANF